jgi:predicted TIM-barrel fold metal-dependent hydrolase
LRKQYDKEKDFISCSEEKLNLIKMEIIDCHTNVGWDVSNLRKNLYPVEQNYTKLLKKMDEFGISKAIILPFPSPSAQFNENVSWYEMENHFLMEGSNYSKRLIPFPGVNPGDKESVRRIKTLVAFGIKGIKFSHQIPMGFSIDKLIGHPLMKIVQDNDLIFMIHTGTGKEPGSHEINTTLNYAIKVARKYPDIRFILCHLGRLHQSLIEALSLENVHLDTSALSMQRKWKEFTAIEPISMFENLTPIKVIEKLVSIGQEDKIVFGSDEPYTVYENEIPPIKEAEITNSAKRKIFYENIKNILKI